LAVSGNFNKVRILTIMYTFLIKIFVVSKEILVIGATLAMRTYIILILPKHTLTHTLRTVEA